MTMSQTLCLLFLFSSIFINCNGQDPCPKSECNGVEIKYPFWQIDPTTSEQFCGYPGFGLNCSNTGQDPVLNLPKAYFVHDIYYENYTLNLIDVDVIDAECPRVRHNLTVEALPLYQTSSDLNLTFYFNCSSPPPPNLPASPINCLDSERNKSYVVEVLINEPRQFDRWYEFCKDKVDVAVKNNEIGRDTFGLISEFGSALNEGFLLNWKTLTGCVECEKSGGRCGFHNTAQEFLCFCQDNTTRRDNQSCRETYALLRNQVIVCYGDQAWFM